MKAVLTFFFSVVLLVLAILVVRTFISGARYAVAAAADGVHTGNFSVGGIGPQMYGPYTIHGTAIMDASHGIPAVPFIEYLNAKNATTTKQLVYYGARACNPAAGDIPCVPTYAINGAYPQVTTGQSITVTGYIYEDRLLVTSMGG